MKIEHKQEGQDGIFYAGTEDEHKAEMIYKMTDGNKMIIEHTEVDDALRGQHVGNHLVKAAVDYARANGIKILALCPFANAVLKKNPEYSDVLFEKK